jgi:DNA-binding GntR family transcriptional regulator
VRLIQKQLWEAVADEVRKQILRGDLQPGTKLGETDLAEKFGVSRGPVREALRELAREGLAVDLPRQGTFVTKPTAADLEELYVVREALEDAAARIAISKAHDKDLLRLRQKSAAVDKAYAEQEVAKAWEVDLAFHRALFDLAGNKRMIRMHDQLATQSLLLMRASVSDNPLLGRVPPASLHRDTAEAIIRRDEIQAQEAIKAHYRWSENRLVAMEVTDAGLQTEAIPTSPRGRS